MPEILVDVRFPDEDRSGRTLWLVETGHGTHNACLRVGGEDTPRLVRADHHAIQNREAADLSWLVTDSYSEGKFRAGTELDTLLRHYVRRRCFIILQIAHQVSSSLCAW
jgi:hypothetical protein